MQSARYQPSRADGVSGQGVLEGSWRVIGRVRSARITTGYLAYNPTFLSTHGPSSTLSISLLTDIELNEKEDKSGYMAEALAGASFSWMALTALRKKPQKRVKGTTGLPRL